MGNLAVIIVASLVHTLQAAVGFTLIFQGARLDEPWARVMTMLAGCVAIVAGQVVMWKLDDVWFRARKRSRG